MDDVMIQRISIEQFRGLHNVEIDDLSRINVFVGTNNSGKTSVLEAVKVMSAPTDFGQLVTVALMRTGASANLRKKNLVNYLLSIFHQEEDKSEQEEKTYSIKMSLAMDGHEHQYAADGTVSDYVTTSGEHQQALDIAIGTSTDEKKKTYKTERFINNTENTYTATERPLFPALYIHSNVNNYRSCVKYVGDYIMQEGKTDIMLILKSFDSNIEDISILNDDIYLYNSVSGSMPLFTYGSGMQKAVLLSSLILYCQNGVVLIDEIDNAIHTSAFERVFSWFIAACKKYHVQAFVSTHSAEAIDAIIDVTDDDDDLRIITLRKDSKSGITRHKIRNGAEARSDRKEFEMELRI